MKMPTTVLPRIMVFMPMVLAPLAGRAAPDQPPVRPTRDVDVTYTMVPPGRTDGLQQRMRWDVADQKLRVDSPSHGFYMLVDYRTRQMKLVQDSDRAFLTVNNGSRPLPGDAPGTGFVRQGEDKVAGLACTDWDTRDTSGQKVTVCITDDGVMLRAQTGPRLLAQAVQVTYGPQNPALFAVPAGYTALPQPGGTPPVVPGAGPASPSAVPPSNAPAPNSLPSNPAPLNAAPPGSATSPGR